MHPVRVALTVEQCWQPVPGGSGSYVVELSRALAAVPQAEVVGLAARHRAGPPADVTPTGPVRFAALPRQALYESWNRLRLPRAESVTGDVDVVHATTWAVPGSRAPLVVTVHDLAFLREPDHFTARGNAFFRRALRVVEDEAVRVVVPSAATRDDCVAHGIEAERVRVVPHGVHADPGAAQRVDRWRRHHGVRRPYLLWCGTLEPRKNVARLVRAYAQACASDGLDHDLVLVGPAGWGDGASQVREALRGLPADSVHMLGRLGSADLQAAYAGASAFVFPSLWEGFGLPVLEAMAHGVPVVTSKGTSMAELVGQDGVLVDPTDVEELASGLVHAVGSDAGPRLRAASERYTWSASAQGHLEVYREALGTS
ncbi:glycosyltransferase family 4 protein [Cellulomonas soli]|uniref:Glycosyl transferase n=1 Tax=Cellulomonas soli TaxID=931535 RepID=A0A512P7Y8_9CELL|nr:glycosyltransferase family 1 protein [Cellulomonas soli]NYI57546.1 glycosyltransferase involved in cell wall biosynthesis [Cellulomonas soli]GEP67323.1 glycosyl transferase [Cellulomonas soli]